MPDSNQRIRCRFSKEGDMRFIGHLDLIALFQRAFRRAKTRVAYSQGFHPHPLLKFALPLSLGMESRGEYFDAEMEENIEPEKIIDLLVLPVGIQITEARFLEKNEKNAASAAAAADYTITLPEDPLSLKTGPLEECMAFILNNRELMTEKKTKGITGSADIRPDILKLSLINDSKIIIKTRLAAGSGRNLKPSLLVRFIYERIFGNNPSWDESGWLYKINYRRDELYTRHGDQYISLMSKIPLNTKKPNNNENILFPQL